MVRRKKGEENEGEEGEKKFKYIPQKKIGPNRFFMAHEKELLKKNYRVTVDAQDFKLQNQIYGQKGRCFFNIFYYFFFFVFN